LEPHQGEDVDGWLAETPVVATPVAPKDSVRTRALGWLDRHRAEDFAGAGGTFDSELFAQDRTARVGQVIAQELFDLEREGAWLINRVQNAIRELEPRRSRKTSWADASSRDFASTEYFSRWLELKKRAIGSQSDAKASRVERPGSLRTYSTRYN